MLVRANDESSTPASFQPQSIIVTSTPYLSRPHMPLATIYQTVKIFIRSLPFSCTIHGPLLKILPLVRPKTSLGILAGNWKLLPIQHLQNTASPTQWLNTKTGLSWNSPRPHYRSITQISVAGVCCFLRGIQPLTQVIYM